MYGAVGVIISLRETPINESDRDVKVRLGIREKAPSSRVDCRSFAPLAVGLRKNVLALPRESHHVQPKAPGAVGFAGPRDREMCIRSGRRCAAREQRSSFTLGKSVTRRHYNSRIAIRESGRD